MLDLAFAALSFPEISPALFTIPRLELGGFGIGPLPIRWYALSYIIGILLAWRYAVYLVSKPALFGTPQSPLNRDDVDDIIFYVTLGVILGGRIGYILFYQIPFAGDRIAADPMMLLRVWEGGMSFHGGLIGVTLAFFWCAHRRKLDLLSVGDIGGLVTPIALLLGRLANFINAELYGRHTEGPLGIVFPEANLGSAPGAYNWATNEWVFLGTEMARHPSQLYEAFLEGLLPLIVLSVLVFSFGLLKKRGLAAGLFLLFYAFGRTVAEQFREPDKGIDFLFGTDFITMGSLLSLPLWLGGLFLVWNALRHKPLSRQT